MKDGYRRIVYRDFTFMAHRVVWLLHHGSWPAHTIDHINTDRGDNCIENLRQATRSQNAFNRPLARANTSGFKGVTWNKAVRKWQATIKANRKNYYLGLFDSAADAHAAYLSAAAEVHGEFARAT